MQYLKVVFHLRCDCVWRCSCHQYALFIFRFVSYRLINFYRKYAFATTKQTIHLFRMNIANHLNTVDDIKTTKFQRKQTNSARFFRFRFISLWFTFCSSSRWIIVEHTLLCAMNLSNIVAHGIDLNCLDKKKLFFCLISQRLSNRNSSSIQKKIWFL